jgi:hypothetical protein
LEVTKVDGVVEIDAVAGGRTELRASWSNEATPPQ